MDNKRKKAAVSAVLSAVLVFFPLLGCSSQNSVGEENSTAVSEADTFEEYYIDSSAIEEVFTEIYKDIPELLKESVKEPSDEEIEEVLKLTVSNMDDHYIRYSSGSFGLADIYIIKPTSDALYEVKRELEDLRLHRIEEFEQYDVYDALTIAQNAEVTEIGNYVVLIMAADADKVMELLRPIIPTGF